MSRIYHVSPKGNDCSSGDEAAPLRTISKAASLADAGDTVVVHEGEYREWVKPARGGKNELSRIVYTAAEGERVVIKGSERITGWEHSGDGVWKAVLPNSFFGDYNPFKETLWGDWFLHPTEYPVHAGDVYLNGRSLYEAESLAAVYAPKERTTGFAPPWITKPVPHPDPKGTLRRWFARVDEEETTIYANFGKADPNRELTEINVRRSCFYPERTGLDYITVRGFEMAQAACPFTPPTADQPALLGPNWSRGWIIENNYIHDAKCSAISLGKDASTGNNDYTRTMVKSGYQYQMEAVFRSLSRGWNYESVGSHIVRNNKICNCGQNAVVGHMGCIRSEICGNEIWNIGTKHEFYGAEIGAIKLHAAIDVSIHDNYIHDCTLGTWLDWQAQGAHLFRNLYCRNVRDLFIEVSHGPHLIENNILASDYCLDNVSQGGAYVNNLFCGSIRRVDALDRTTPYHFAHSTAPLGTAFIFGGDDRYFNNIFLGGVEPIAADSACGTELYKGFCASFEEYLEKLKAAPGVDHVKYFAVRQPVYIDRNAYLRGAGHFDREETFCALGDFDPQVRIFDDCGGVWLEITLPEEFFSLRTEIQSTATLGVAHLPGAVFDNPDGSFLTLDRDYFGELRRSGGPAGPIESLKPGFNRIKVF